MSDDNRTPEVETVEIDWRDFGGGVSTHFEGRGDFNAGMLAGDIDGDGAVGNSDIGTVFGGFWGG